METNRRGFADDGACCKRQEKVKCETLMFTGIIEETGTVEKIERGKKSIALTICAKISARGLKLGGSLAVNGCCLTAVKISSRGKFKLVQFDLLAETWSRTNFQLL